MRMEKEAKIEKTGKCTQTKQYLLSHQIEQMTKILRMMIRSPTLPKFYPDISLNGNARENEEKGVPQLNLQTLVISGFSGA